MKQRPAEHVDLGRAALLLLCLPAWLALFTLGLVVNTRPLLMRYDPDLAREASDAIRAGWVLGSDPQTVHLWRDFLILVTCYTPANVAILCVLSSVLGAMAARVRLGPDEDGPTADRTRPFLSALLRGFFVYLVLLSGMLIVTGDPFASPTSSDYARLAGLISVFSFALSYSPATFSGLLGRVLDVVSRQSRTSETFERKAAVAVVTETRSLVREPGEDREASALDGAGMLHPRRPTADDPLAEKRSGDGPSGPLGSPKGNEAGRPLHESRTG